MGAIAEKTIHVTPKAVAKIKEAFAKQGLREGGLRLGVVGGGCSGLSYLFRLDPKARPNDHVFEFDGVKIFVDPKSMVYLNGLTLDYKESLIYSGFVFNNPNAQKTCGCGTSFSA
jgi:iron-sulfur cluster assembly protein